MPAPRLITILLLTAVSLAPWPSAGQAPTPKAHEIAFEPLFEITLPCDLLPDPPVALSWEEIRLEPGAEVPLTANHDFRGTGIHALEGEMSLTLPIDALAWYGADAVNGDSTVVAAGETLHLAPGDVVYIPDSPGSTATTTTAKITNDGEVAAHGVGFRIWAEETDPWQAAPDGMRTHTTLSMIEDPAAFTADTVTVALDGVTLQPGQSLHPDPAIPATFYQVIDGRISYSWTTPDGETTIAYTWAPRVGRWMPWDSGVTSTFTPAGDEPATLFVLRVEPGDGI